MRRWEWPPSRVRCQRSGPPSSPALKGTPNSASRSMAAGARPTTCSTTARSFRPAPATIVSSTWSAKLSPASSTAAIPPCAQAVEPSSNPPLASTATRQWDGRLSAAVSPAAPEPTITTSKGLVMGTGCRRGVERGQRRRPLDRGVRSGRVRRMDDRITRLERLAALHREGALSDDEFRNEKLRVLAGRDLEADPVAPTPPAAEEPAVPPAEPAVVEEPPLYSVTGPPDDEPVADPYLPPPPKRSSARWWLIGTGAVILALIGAIWYASSIPIADAPRSSIGTAGPRVAAAPAPVVEEPEEEGPTDVSDALTFSNAGQCEFGGEAERAFKALLSERDGEWTTGGPVTLGALTLTPKLEVERSTDDGPGSARYYAYARAPDGVRWNGLTLSRIVHSLNLPAESDSQEERSITFRDDPDRVQRVLRDLGVTVPVGEDYRALEDGACGGSMQIKAIPGGSALVCQWGC